MDKVTRDLPEAPISCLADDRTPCFAEETPAPNRDPPCAAEAEASSSVPSPAAPPLPAAPPPLPPPGPPRLNVPVAEARALAALRPLALSVVMRVGVPARDAPDVVQNLFVSLLWSWSERAGWPPDRQADYVAAAARIVARRYRWKAARRPEDLESIGAIQALQEHAADERSEAFSVEDLLVLQAVCAEQAKETRLDFLQASTAPAFWRVFHGYVVLGVAISAIAQAEGAPVPTIYNRLRLARRDLRAAIGRLRATKGR